MGTGNRQIGGFPRDIPKSIEIHVRGGLMYEERLIDDLIEAGWYVLDTDIDETAFQNWRKRALLCLTDLLGPEHVYVLQFNDWIRHRGKLNLMAAGGVLAAAKEVAFGQRSAAGRVHPT